MSKTPWEAVDVAKFPLEESARKPPQVYYFCSTHPDRPLQCTACNGKLGGQANVRKHGTEQARVFGRLGGRPKKKRARKKKAAG